MVALSDKTVWRLKGCAIRKGFFGGERVRVVEETAGSIKKVALAVVELWMRVAIIKLPYNFNILSQMQLG